MRKIDLSLLVFIMAAVRDTRSDQLVSLGPRMNEGEGRDVGEPTAVSSCQPAVPVSVGHLLLSLESAELISPVEEGHFQHASSHLCLSRSSNAKTAL